MLRTGKVSPHLDNCLILKGIDVCECQRCPSCNGLPNTHDHRPGVYPDEPNGLTNNSFCEFYASGARFWRRLNDSEASSEHEAAR